MDIAQDTHAAQMTDFRGASVRDWMMLAGFISQGEAFPRK
jgi:hypothetical protein